MADLEKPKTLSELIATTPAAQPLDQALENIRVRRKRLLEPRAGVAEPTIAPEAVPVIDKPEEFASEFWARRAAKKQLAKKPKGRQTKAPHLTIHDNETPDTKK